MKNNGKITKKTCAGCGSYARIFKDELCQDCYNQAEMSSYMNGEAAKSAPHGFFNTLIGWLMMFMPHDDDDDDGDKQ